MIDKEHPIVGKLPNGPLKVIIIGRLSKPKETEGQTEDTIESSMVFAKEYLERVYKGPIEFRCLGEQISGMVADRATILEAYELVETGEIDLVIVEDVSRVSRNNRHMFSFVQDMVDSGTRFIAVADSLDTADDNWETMLNVAGLRHGLVVPDTRRRVRRTAKYSFHNGGMVQRVKFGYRKVSREDALAGLVGPKGLRIAKLPEKAGILAEIRRRLMNTRRPPSVVAWLNRERIAPGPMVKNGKWTVDLLKNLVCDPLLHGGRAYMRTIYTRILKSGKYRRDRNPQPEFEHVPELAFMTKEEQEAMVAAVGWEICWSLPLPRLNHPRRGVSRYKSYWPSQTTKCGICGLPMYKLGNFLRCPRSYKKHGYACWNRVQVPLELTRKIFLDWLLKQFESYPEARRLFVNAAWSEIQRCRGRKTDAEERRLAEIADLESQQQRLATAIAKGAKLKPLLDLLGTVDAKLKKLKRDSVKERESEGFSSGCKSKEIVEQRIDEALFVLMRHSYDFNDVMREFFPAFVVLPVQALDSGQVHPRGKLRFVLSPEQAPNRPEQIGEVTFDLFEPPVHIELLPKVLQAYAEMIADGKRPSYKKVAARVGTSYMTVKRAMHYDRLMKAAGVNDPFRELTERPVRASRWRERKNEQYGDAA